MLYLVSLKRRSTGHGSTVETVSGSITRIVIGAECLVSGSTGSSEFGVLIVPALAVIGSICSVTVVVIIVNIKMVILVLLSVIAIFAIENTFHISMLDTRRSEKVTCIEALVLFRSVVVNVGINMSVRSWDAKRLSGMLNNFTFISVSHAEGLIVIIVMASVVISVTIWTVVLVVVVFNTRASVVLDLWNRLCTFPHIILIITRRVFAVLGMIITVPIFHGSIMSGLVIRNVSVLLCNLEFWNLKWPLEVLLLIRGLSALLLDFEVIIFDMWWWL